LRNKKCIFLAKKFVKRKGGEKDDNSGVRYINQ